MTPLGKRRCHVPAPETELNALSRGWKSAFSLKNMTWRKSMISKANEHARPRHEGLRLRNWKIQPIAQCENHPHPITASGDAGVSQQSIMIVPALKNINGKSLRSRQAGTESRRFEYVPESWQPVPWKCEPFLWISYVVHHIRDLMCPMPLCGVGLGPR